ncbi:glycosyltransferase [Bacteroidales bacterium OttesenSCG-928-M11]|nr:glycosyltransferase [Bacteroidales bacterium OttesenSCG-928-M11]
MAKIIVSVTNDLLTDQRVHKVCTSLFQAGHEVTLVGRRLENKSKLSREYKTFRMPLLFNKTFLFFTEYNIRLFFYLLFKKADLFLSNDTDTLLANYLASSIRNKPLLFDAHEMFPELPELFGRPKVKRIWERIEDFIFPKLKYSYTVCQSIAEEYKTKYGINMEVVRNIPFEKKKQSIAKPTENEKLKNKKIILYQGAVNIGRGIEWMIDAMTYLDDYVFLVVGGGDILEELKAKVDKQKLNDRVIFTGRVPFEELSSYTTMADIGINLLENKGLNYYYSLPNRIFDLTRNCIPILATDFPEVRRIVQQYNLGILIDHYESEYLAEKVKELMNNIPPLEGFHQANKDLTWEKESTTILKLVDKALRRLV